jgi:hypothetical protein
MMLSVVHNLANCRSDYIHFIGGKPIATRKIAGGASRSHIAFDMGQSVVDAIQSTRLICSSTINTWLHNHGQNLSGAKVASINPFVSRPQKYRPPFVSSAVTLLPSYNLFTLLRRMLGPSVGSFIAPALAITVASPALIGQSKRATAVTQENFWRSLQKVFTPIAISKAIFW